MKNKLIALALIAILSSQSIELYAGVDGSIVPSISFSVEPVLIATGALGLTTVALGAVAKFTENKKLKKVIHTSAIGIKYVGFGLIGAGTILGTALIGTILINGSQGDYTSMTTGMQIALALKLLSTPLAAGTILAVTGKIAEEAAKTEESNS